MLDSETKRRIDTARDVLVGKVPDPKSQVEQITVALIYKFMDDMDTQAEELGGKRKFFAGEFAKYGWAKLMAPSVSGEERIALYAEGMIKMPQNPGIPKLFRDIFKNAYLPYRDPETLHLFLKTVNDFEYDHSERLGDAFEYLLSVLGSQGDAGQFRTPRHIIDFIVSIVDPKKTETVLDPACGTAGFLISSYKHILRANSTPAAIAKTNGNGEAALHTSRIPPAKGDKLSPDERKKLADNFCGYDISPDMVRLSLVNMYLHGFTDPHVFEYDTLTSQDRWNEMADVILANPPFMSPKGGIKPHNRFSVPSKRSEVLFVDYMAEHLTPGGRAGIIVPEGIIFQSQTAYKALRKMLVEQYLVAVVSLPAGVFNPYSGVKTSILILDKSLAKQSDTVGFFKVENDGFGLGAQRRPIDRNDLPLVLAEINEYLRRLRAKESVAPQDFTPTRGLIVAKEKIAANGDFNLGGERYRENGKHAGNWPMVKLGDVAEYTNGFPFKPEDWHGEGLPIIRIQNLTGSSKDINRTQRDDVPAKYLVRRGDLLISWSATIGFYIWQDEDSYLNQHIFRVDVKPEIDKTYLYFLGSRITAEIEKDVHGNTMQHITKGRFEAIEIPLPPLEVQKEIVAEIEAYQKVIDGARAVLDHYRPHIPINPEWPVVTVADVIEGSPKNGYSGSPVQHETELKVLSLSATTSGQMDLTKFKYLDDKLSIDAPCRCRKGDIYLQRGNTRELVGTSALFDSDAPDFVYPDLMIRLRANGEKIDTKYFCTR
jgi:type I restriction enzyme M protein